MRTFVLTDLDLSAVAIFSVALRVRGLAKEEAYDSIRAPWYTEINRLSENQRSG